MNPCFIEINTIIKCEIYRMAILTLKRIFPKCLVVFIISKFEIFDHPFERTLIPAKYEKKYYKVFTDKSSFTIGMTEKKCLIINVMQKKYFITNNFGADHTYEYYEINENENEEYLFSLLDFYVKLSKKVFNPLILPDYQNKPFIMKMFELLKKKIFRIMICKRKIEEVLYKYES